MKFINILFLFILLFSSCKSSETNNINNKEEIKKQELLAKISLFEKKGLKSSKGIKKSDRDSLINALNNFYYAFPKDKKTPFCLDKLQMIYSSTEDYKKCSEYLDIIIQNFPKYVNRPLIIEAQASNYDIFIQPRDSSKVRLFYNLLLSENPNLDKEKKKNILRRLENNHLSFNQYLQLLKEQGN